MAEQPFTYSIQYPENGSPDEDDDEKNSFEVIHKSEAEDLPPVVVLLGWAGCLEKHLRKYTPMYVKKGYITVTLIVPAKTLFFHAYKIQEVAKGLLNALVENKLLNNPIFFHVFSNGGCMVYSQLSEILNTVDFDENNPKLSVRGIIFDSCPGKRRILNAVRAFMSTLQFGEVLRYLLGFCLLLYLVFTRFLRMVLPGFLAMERGFQLYDSICMDLVECPQLFLYSKADKVILAEDVEEVISTRKERGVEVKSMCWDDSQHVAHMRDHPEVYTKACLDFVEACMAS